jgi:hypothetical protein
MLLWDKGWQCCAPGALAFVASRTYVGAVPGCRRAALVHTLTRLCCDLEKPKDHLQGGSPRSAARPRAWLGRAAVAAPHAVGLSAAGWCFGVWWMGGWGQWPQLLSAFLDWVADHLCAVERDQWLVAELVCNTSWQDHCVTGLLMHSPTQNRSPNTGCLSAGWQTNPAWQHTPLPRACAHETDVLQRSDGYALREAKIQCCV